MRCSCSSRRFPRVAALQCHQILRPRGRPCRCPEDVAGAHAVAQRLLSPGEGVGGAPRLRQAHLRGREGRAGGVEDSLSAGGLASLLILLYKIIFLIKSFSIQSHQSY